MKQNFTKTFYLIIIIFLTSKGTLQAQQVKNYQTGFFYIGFSARLFTLGEQTNAKKLFSTKFGYNLKLREGIFTGPVLEAMLIKSPAHKATRISYFAGPSVDYEISTPIYNKSNIRKPYSSARLSWVVPLNPRSNDYTYGDCLSLNAAVNNDKFYDFNRTSFDLSFDFQKYDDGFSMGFGRVINVSSGTRIAL